jgi:NitT/TauT family transport system substrate-binding protein
MRYVGQLTWILILLVSGCGEPPLDERATGDDGHVSVKLALNWYPEAEHGGYFAADELNHFSTAKLNVEIIHGRPGASRIIMQELATGRIDFAISSADQVVEQRARGLPIVALLAPVQKSPRCIMVHTASGFASLEELASVELAVSETRPFALWMKKQLPLKDVTLVPFNGSVGEFLAKSNFAQQAYVFSEPFIAREQGSDPAVLMLSDIGYNPYASVLVTSEDVLKEQPEIVRSMVTASRLGWTAYLDTPDATNHRLHRENEDMSLAALDYGATALHDLCQTENNAPIGSMTAGRWQELIDQLVELDIIDRDSVKPQDCFRELP